MSQQSTNTIEKSIPYTPSSIVNIFNNALNSAATKTVLQAKGVYVKGRGVNYNGVYYDQLKEETSDACMTLIVPAIIRTELVPDQVIECYGYLTKKVQANGARIELQMNMMELISQNESKYTDEQVKAFKLLQRKVELGYKDVDSFLKGKIVREERIKIIILLGANAVIGSDIKHQLEEAISFYDFQFEKINLSSESSIIDALLRFDNEGDLLIISRGGGDNLGIFNRLAIAETALKLDSHFVTAIGHEVDRTLLQQVADKAFITPTALGQYLNSLYNDTIVELQNSKAKMVEDITKQLAANYEHQINNLKEQNTNALLLHQNQVKELEKLSEEQLKLAKQSTNKTLYWILIVAAIVIGFLIGRIG